MCVFTNNSSWCKNEADVMSVLAKFSSNQIQLLINEAVDESDLQENEEMEGVLKFEDAETEELVDNNLDDNSEYSLADLL